MVGEEQQRHGERATAARFGKKKEQQQVGDGRGSSISFKRKSSRGVGKEEQQQVEDKGAADNRVWVQRRRSGSSFEVQRRGAAERFKEAASWASGALERRCSSSFGEKKVAEAWKRRRAAAG